MILLYLYFFFLSSLFLSVEHFQQEDKGKTVSINGQQYDIYHFIDPFSKQKCIRFKSSSDTLIWNDPLLQPVLTEENDSLSVFFPVMDPEEVLFLVNPYEEIIMSLRSLLNENVIHELSHLEAFMESCLLVDSIGHVVECEHFLSMSHLRLNDSIYSALSIIDNYAKLNLLFEDNGKLHHWGVPYARTRIRFRFHKDSISIKAFHNVHDPEVDLSRWEIIRYLPSSNSKSL